MAFSPDLVWPPERVDRLRELWAEGLSASQIAAHLDGVVTRNAVIGKLHRLGLTRLQRETEIEDQVRAALIEHAETTPFLLGAEKGKVPRPQRQPRTPWPPQEKLPRSAPPKKLPAAHSPELTPSTTTARAAPVTLYDLTENTCRYPLGPTQDHPPFHYCGARTVPGKSWCRKHYDRVFERRAR